MIKRFNCCHVAISPCEGKKNVSWMKINTESIEIAAEVQKRQGLQLIWKLGQLFPFPVPLLVICGTTRGQCLPEQWLSGGLGPLC